MTPLLAITFVREKGVCVSEKMNQARNLKFDM